MQGLLAQLCDLPIDLGQGCLQGDMTPWLGDCLMQNDLPLQMERLYLALPHSARPIVQAPRILADKAAVRADLQLLQGTCHLFLHVFTFPSTSHIFILRDFGRVASRQMTRLIPATLEDFPCTSVSFRRLA